MKARVRRSQPSKPSGEQEDYQNDEEQPADARRPIAVGMVSPVRESTEDEGEKNDE